MSTTTVWKKRRVNGFSQATQPTSFEHPVEHQQGVSRKRYWEQSTDFLEVAGSTLPAWLAKQDTSAAGSPTTDYVANQAAGLYRMKFDSQAEVQKLTLYGGDHLTVDPTKNPFFVCRVKLDVAGTAFTAAERAVFGFASARNATLDSVTYCAWIRLDGANNNIYVEGDDNVTDTNLQDSTLDYTDASFMTLAVDIDSAAKRAYFAVDLEGGAGWQHAGSVSLAAIVNTNLLQPFIEIQKDSGALTEDLLVDYLSFGAAR